MNITTITPPPFEPVTLAQVYQHLRLSPDHEGSPGEETHPDDLMLTRHITTAREQVEKMTRRSLVQQTLRLSMPGFPTSVRGAFPASRTQAPEVIRLYRPPVLRVESVSYFDADNALALVDAASYYVTDEEVPELRFNSGFAAPAVYERPDAVRVLYVTGFTPIGSPPESQADFIANVPSTLRDAILVGVQLLQDDMTPADAEAARKMQELMVQPHRVHLSL